jgi:hypothetical protein
MALPDQRNINFYEGSTYRQRFDVVDDQDRPVLLTNFTAKLQIREEPGAAVLHEASSENGQLIVNGPDGTVTIDIPGSTIDGWEFESGMYDMFVISSAGKAYAIARGTVQVHPAITTV